LIAAFRGNQLNHSRQKCALLIIDGLGDLPVPALANQTPLEAARTPVLDRLAASGRYGLMDPIARGEIPNTHSGSSLLLGIRPEQVARVVRGPVEASGAGCSLQAGDIALRANFATVEVRDDALFVLDRRAGRITNGADELSANLRDVDLGDGVKADFISTDQHRGVLVLSGPGLDAAVSDTDPGDVDLPALFPYCRPKQSGAEFTAGKINIFIEEAHRRLQDHALNIARIAAGKLPANGLITRGAGAWFSVDNVLDEHGISTAVVAGCNTVRGLGKMFGFEAISDPRFTAAFDTDLNAKMSSVVASLDRHDMVYLHIKAPDICAHDCKPTAKRDFIERIDQALEILVAAGSIIALTADHTTDSNTGFHTADPVPALLYDPATASTGKTVNFGEEACRNGNMERQRSVEFLRQIVQAMGY
jgi:2,3-bisphosphoglycerate-independent phosphoglycerate mutase